MPKPKAPPVPFRPPVGSDLMDRVDAWAEARGLKRNAALAELIGLGLDGAARASPRSAPPAPAEPKVRPAATAPFKSRLKGEWKAP